MTANTSNRYNRFLLLANAPVKEPVPLVSAVKALAFFQCIGKKYRGQRSSENFPLYFLHPRPDSLALSLAYSLYFWRQTKIRNSKFEIRNRVFQTNSNDKKINDRNKNHLWLSFEAPERTALVLNFGHLRFVTSNLFPISCFKWRALEFIFTRRLAYNLNVAASGFVPTEMEMKMEMEMGFKVHPYPSFEIICKGESRIRPEYRIQSFFRVLRQPALYLPELPISSAFLFHKNQNVNWSTLLPIITRWFHRSIAVKAFNIYNSINSGNVNYRQTNRFDGWQIKLEKTKLGQTRGPAPTEM
ncbi:MAG: hypothetical protein MUF15_13255, partial [Acidobacteria bacterium]|nr:hypothetical protein [Acidobacteriota bacterium]